MKTTHWIASMWLSLTLCAAHAQSTNLRQAVNNFVYYRLDSTQLPRLMVGIVDGDSTHLFYYGDATATDVVEIGALTKVLTAMLVHQLVNEGKLDYKTPIVRYLEMKGLQDKNIVLADLIHHTSRLPRLPYNFGEYATADQPYSEYTLAMLDSFLVGFQPVSSPHTYEYSHINYALLGEIVSRTQGQPLDTLLYRYLTAPLGMTATQFATSPRLIAGYRKDGTPAPAWKVQPMMEAAVGAVASLPDLVAFLRLQVADTTAYPLAVLARATHQPIVRTHLKKVTAAKGWHIILPQKRYYPIVGHSGATGGHQAYIAFVQETRTGVVVLANTAADLKELGFYLLKMLNHDWYRTH